MQRFYALLGTMTLTAVLGACTQNSPQTENPNDASLSTQDIAIPQGAPLIDFVKAFKPQWNFDRAVGNNACFPEPAIYLDRTLNPGAEPDMWPNADPVDTRLPHKDGSSNEGSDDGNGCLTDLEAFPTYYSVQKCHAEEEIKVSYTIYLPNSYLREGGHVHDFEGIYVIWKRDVDNDVWTRSELVMGRHRKWKSRWWQDAESWNPDLTEVGLGYERPRIFVGWASHAMFNNQGGLTDVISQLYDQEHRSDKYPAGSGSLVEVTVDNELGRQFDESKDHFGAGLEGNPVYIARDLCGLSSGDFSG